MLEKLKNTYSKKIITIKSLNKIVGSRPRKEKVILCHGNFDVVHPGHVRHLIYAKSKADILVVSITADKFIQKVFTDHLFPKILEPLILQLLRW